MSMRAYIETAIAMFFALVSVVGMAYLGLWWLFRGFA